MSYLNKLQKVIKYKLSSKRVPGIISDIDSNKYQRFVFNLIDRKNTHVGDVLFLLPAILILQRYFLVLVLVNEDIKSLLVNFGYKEPELSFRDSIEITYIWNDNISNKNYIWLNVADSSIEENPSHLILNFLKKNGYPIESDIELIYKAPNKTCFNTNYFIYSNECESGLFRLWFGARGKLDRMAINLNKNGLIPIVVGTKPFNQIPKFVDCIDLRGKTTLSELGEIINSNEISILSFDNALVHLGVLLNKPKIIISMRWFSFRYTKYLKKCIFPVWNSSSRITYL